MAQNTVRKVIVGGKRKSTTISDNTLIIEIEFRNVSDKFYNILLWNIQITFSSAIINQ